LKKQNDNLKEKMKLKKNSRNTMEAGNNKVLDFKRKSINLKSSTDEKI